MYAVLETGSKQYRVAAGETLDVERLEVAAGQPHTLERVLMVSNDPPLRAHSQERSVARRGTVTR